MVYYISFLEETKVQQNGNGNYIVKLPDMTIDDKENESGNKIEQLMTFIGVLFCVGVALLGVYKLFEYMIENQIIK